MQRSLHPSEGDRLPVEAVGVETFYTDVQSDFIRLIVSLLMSGCSGYMAGDQGTASCM